ncbi:MAG: hypothetical protein JWR61_2840 [Ferruginibacter sp.]|nr:hypothetical protein [Ferruginibacter sp.]
MKEYMFCIPNAPPVKKKELLDPADKNKTDVA